MDNKEKMQVCVLGNGRSGTTSLYVLLQEIYKHYFSGQENQVSMVYEPFLWGESLWNDHYDDLSNRWGNVSSLSVEGMYWNKKIPMFLENINGFEDIGYFNSIFRSKEKPNLISKFIRANGRLKLLSHYCPQCKIIFIIRHPISVVNSIITKFSSYGDDYHKSDYPRFIDEVQKIFQVELDPNASVVEKEIFYWYYMNQYFFNTAKQNKENILTICFEDYQQDKKKYIKKICRFLGLNYKNTFYECSNKNIGQITNNICLTGDDLKIIEPYIVKYREMLDMNQVCFKEKSLIGLETKVMDNLAQDCPEQDQDPNLGKNLIYLRDLAKKQGHMIARRDERIRNQLNFITTYKEELKQKDVMKEETDLYIKDLLMQIENRENEIKEMEVDLEKVKEKLEDNLEKVKEKLEDNLEQKEEILRNQNIIINDKNVEIKNLKQYLSDIEKNMLEKISCRDERIQNQMDIIKTRDEKVRELEKRSIDIKEDLKKKVERRDKRIQTQLEVIESRDKLIKQMQSKRTDGPGIIGPQFLEQLELRLANIKQEQVRLINRINFLEPILVYQMGKVASSSIEKTLQHCGFKNVFHVHRIDRENIGNMKRILDKKGMSLTLSDIQGLYVDKFKLYKGARIITLVRDPVARNFSAYFQNYKEMTDQEFSRSTLSIEEMANSFIRKYPHQMPLRWFDIEFRKVLGIDVYQHPFDKTKGFQLIQHNDMKILILKVEIDDNTKTRALRQILKIDDLQLVNENVGKKKEYADAYEKFKKQIQLPEEYLSQMYQSRYMKHFYTQEEIDRLWRKWNKET